MADQPPLADATTGGKQTKTSLLKRMLTGSKRKLGALDLEKTWARMWTSEYKPHIISILYLIFALAFIAICVFSHSIDDKSFHSGIWSYGIFHLQPFQLESYDFSLLDSCNPWKLEGTEVWEFWAIMLTGVFSVLLFFQPEEKPGVGLIIFCGLSIFLACPLALLFLGLHFTKLYESSLLFMVAGLAIVDGLMFKASKGSVVEKYQYRFLQFFVDIPILLSLAILVAYVGFPMRQSHKDFFSGALAFQFIMGCLLVLLVKGYEIIYEDCNLARSRWAPILLIFVFAHPVIRIRKIRAGRKKKREAEKAERDSGRSKGGSP